jgi:hypothetical protein
LQGAFKSANFVKDKYYLTALVNKMNLKKLVSIGLCIFIIVSILPISFVHGATVAVTVTPSAVVDGDTTNKEVLFLPSTALINQSKLYVYYPSSYTDTSLVAGDVTVTKNTPSSDANYTSASTSVDTTNNVLTITLTTSGTLDTTNSIKVVIAGAKLVASSTGGSPAGVNHSFGIATDNLSGGGDIGASLQYVGSLNKVQVTAIVPPVLTFAIRNSADTAELTPNGTQKVCNLGVLSLTAVSSCAYRLKVTTNATGGYTISYNSNTRLSNGSYNFADSAIGSPGTTIAAGTEMYGVVLTKGAISSLAAVNRYATKFSSDGDAAKSFRITEAAGPYLVLTADGYNAPSATDTTNTTLMTHQAAISGVTPTGSYSHIVTYTVAATF